jgi:hypothetical protein
LCFPPGWQFCRCPENLRTPQCAGSCCRDRSLRGEPLRVANTACVPQKHPPANTAFTLAGLLASKSSVAGAGTGPAPEAFAVSVNINPVATTTTTKTHATRQSILRPQHLYFLDRSHASWLQQIRAMRPERDCRTLADLSLAINVPTGKVLRAGAIWLRCMCNDRDACAYRRS